MSFAILYHPLVIKKDIPKLGAETKKRIKQAIESKLTTHPEVFGIPLRHSRSGDRKLRVGAYRVVFHLTGTRVKIDAIEHRSVVYNVFEKRTHL